MAPPTVSTEEKIVCVGTTIDDLEFGELAGEIAKAEIKLLAEKGLTKPIPTAVKGDETRADALKFYKNSNEETVILWKQVKSEIRPDGNESYTANLTLMEANNVTAGGSRSYDIVSRFEVKADNSCDKD